MRIMIADFAVSGLTTTDDRRFIADLGPRELRALDNDAFGSGLNWQPGTRIWELGSVASVVNRFFPHSRRFELAEVLSSQ